MDPLLITIEPINNSKSKNIENWTVYGSTSQSYHQPYKPQNTNDLFRNIDNIKLMKSWIQDKMNKIPTYDYVHVVGKAGTGKSEFIRACFKDLKYNIIEYDQNINKAELEIIKESIIFSSIEKMFGGQSLKGIIIDNFVDNMGTTQLTEILKLLKNKQTSPTVFVSNNLNKCKDVLKGNGLLIDFEEPMLEDITALANKICKNEKIKISRCGINSLINNCKIIGESDEPQHIYNIRNLISTISMLGNKSSKSNKKSVDNEMVVMAKDIETDIYTTIDRFVNPQYSNNFEDIRMTSMYTSSIIHENYINMVKKDTDIEDLLYISESNCIGDIYKKKMLNDQYWELCEYIGIFGTYLPGTIIKKNHKPFKKLKINGNFSDIKTEKGFGMSPIEISYCLSKIFFPLECNPSNRSAPKGGDSSIRSAPKGGDTVGGDIKWIKQMKKSSNIFYNFMHDNHITDVSKAIKYIDKAYKFTSSYDPVIIRKIKTKFRTEWKLIENK